MIIKKDLYRNEQYELMNKIIKILNLNDDNSIIFYELDNDVDKINKINELIPDVKKYFKNNSVKSLKYPEQVKRVYLSIIKYVLKLEYTMISTDYRLKKNDILIRTKKYYFLKK